MLGAVYLWGLEQELLTLQLVAVVGAISQQSLQGLQQGGNGPPSGSVSFKGLTWPLPVSFRGVPADTVAHMVPKQVVRPSCVLRLNGVQLLTTLRRRKAPLTASSSAGRGAACCKVQEQSGHDPRIRPGGVRAGGS